MRDRIITQKQMRIGLFTKGILPGFIIAVLLQPAFWAYDKHLYERRGHEWPGVKLFGAHCKSFYIK